MMKLKLYSRRYAPFKSFGGGFKGDDRNYSTSMHATSKTYGIVELELKHGTFRMCSVKGGSSGSSHLFSGKTRGTAKSLVRTSVTDLTSQKGKIGFTLYSEGNLPLGSMLRSGVSWKGREKTSANESYEGSPDIDTFLDITFQVVSNSEVRVKGKIRGDGFPNAEVFLLDNKNNSIGIIDFRTKSGWTGPFHRLFGDGKNNQICSFDKQVCLAGDVFATKNDPPKVIQEE